MHVTVGAPERAASAGRYAVIAPIASGGMATIHLGRMLGAGGFSRHVAIKRLHPHFASDPDFVSMLLDEGRMAARIAHPNVVATLDVVRTPDDLFLVMEYVEGVSLAFVLRALRATGGSIPTPIAIAIAVGTLHGLHAAHEARDSEGAPLDLVHRDVSPQNVLLAADGVPRVADFGIAKAAGRTHFTRDGEIKGKVPYMAPEQLRAGELDRRVDIWAAGVVLYEMLAGARPFRGEGNQMIGEILYGKVPSITDERPDAPVELEAVLRRALARFPEGRFATAREMAQELERALRPASASEVGTWIEQLARAELQARTELVGDLERRATECIILETGPGQPPSATSRTMVERRVRSLRTMSAALGALVAILLAVLLVPLALRRESTPSVAAPTFAPEPAPPPSASIRTVTGEPDPLPTPTPSLVANAPIAPRPAKRTAPSPSRAPHRSPKSARPGDERCYSLDAEGIWHIRPECL